MIKKTVSSIIAACLILLSPGLGTYEAAAQAFKVSARTNLRISAPLGNVLHGMAVPGSSLNLPASVPSNSLTAKQSIFPKLSAQPRTAPAALPASALPAAPSAAAAAALGAPTAASLLADPAAVAPSADTLAAASPEGARGAVDTAMARILGQQEARPSDTGSVTAPPAADSVRTGLRPAAAPHAKTAASVAEPRESSAANTIKRAIGGSIAAGLVAPVMTYLLTGVALGPASPAFFLFSGTLLFWSILQSITLHEVGHALAADRLGDVTPRMAKQISINPLRFTSPGGATLLLVSSMLGFPFGAFATNLSEAFADSKNRAALGKIAAMGPLVNFGIAAAVALGIILLKAAVPGLMLLPWVGGTLRVLAFSALINVALGVMNLIPFGPLDGQKIFTSLIPERWHKLASNATFIIGILLFLLYMACSLLAPQPVAPQAASSAAGAAAAHPAPSLFEMTKPALLANGVGIWIFAVWPGIKSTLIRIRQLISRLFIYKAGGIALHTSLPVLEGKSPIAGHRNILIAAPFSGTDEARADLVTKDPYSPAELSNLLQLPAEDRKAVRSTDGSVLDEAGGLTDAVRSGRLLLLKHADRLGLVAVPAELMGGPAEVRKIIATASVARLMEGGRAQRRLLTRPQAAVVIRLSQALKTPVYELDFSPDSEHPGPARFARTDHGPALFLRYDVIAQIAAASSAEQALRLTELTSELSRFLQDFR